MKQIPQTYRVTREIISWLDRVQSTCGIPKSRRMRIVDSVLGSAPQLENGGAMRRRQDVIQVTRVCVAWMDLTYTEIEPRSGPHKKT